MSGPRSYPHSRWMVLPHLRTSASRSQLTAGNRDYLFCGNVAWVESVATPPKRLLKLASNVVLGSLNIGLVVQISVSMGAIASPWQRQAITLTATTCQSPQLRQGGTQSVPRTDDRRAVNLSLFLSIGCKLSSTASCRPGSYFTLSTQRQKISAAQNRPCRRSGRSTTCPHRSSWVVWCLTR